MIAEGAKFYHKDIAYRKVDENKIEFGVILETFTNKHNHKHSDIIWLSNGKSHPIPLDADELTLYDRFLQKGNIVKRVGDNSQLGRCFDVNTIASIRILDTDKVITNISVDALQPLKDFSVNDVVLHKNQSILPDGVDKYYLGVIKKVQREIILEASDATEYIMNDEVISKFSHSNDSWKNHLLEQCPPYKGQVLSGSASLFENTKKGKAEDEIVKPPKGKQRRLSAQIKEIIVNELEIDWITNFYYGEEDKVDQDPPSKYFKYVDKITKLDGNFPVGNFHGACCGYKIRETDTIRGLAEWQEEVDASWITANTTTTPTIDDDTIAGAMCYNANNVDKPFLIDAEMANAPLDINVEQIKPQDNQSKRKKSIEKIQRIKRGRYTMNANEESEFSPVSFRSGEFVAAEVILCKRTVSILWQDGTLEKGIPSCELLRMSHVDINEHIPGDFVMESSVEPDLSLYGCIKKVNHVKRTVLVTWMRCSLINTMRFSVKKIKEEECSVYSIKKKTAFNFKPGALVVRLNRWVDYDLYENIGRVVKVQNTFEILINWLNGTEELMMPQELHCVNAPSYNPESGNYSMINIEDVINFSLKNIVENPLSEISRILDIFCRNPSFNNACQVYKLFELSKYCVNFGRLLIKCFGIYADHSEGKWKKFLIDFTTTNSQKAKMIYDTFCSNSFSTNSKQLKKNDSKFEYMLNDNDKQQKQKNTSKNELKKSLEHSNKSKEGSNINNPIECHMLCIKFEEKLHKYQRSDSSTLNFLKCFKEQLYQLFCFDNSLKNDDGTNSHNSSKNFTIVSDVLDLHHYSESNPSNSLSFLNTVNKEKNILKTVQLPGISIKGFSGRSDLYSVLIEGSKNTPYEYGLFMFDFKLPENYPDTFPDVFYVSFCTDKLNPNLCENGKVRMSLLGTGEEKEIEQWASKQSNLYQLLVSIQQLILVAEPYFLESGNDEQVETFQDIEYSRLYNEMVLIKTVESMIAMIERPPKVFKNEIHMHFKRNGPDIMNKYKAYVLTDDGTPSAPMQSNPKFSLLPVSEGFSMSFLDCLKKLEKAIDSINIA